MSTLRISDAPLLPDVDGTEKIPTGGRGDYTISVDQIKDHIFQDIGKELVGLGNVDNTSDLDKPVSTAQQAALNLKADKTYVDSNLDLKADKTNVYTRSETSLSLSKKADLVNGVVPENQIPSSFNDVLEFTTTNLPIVGESGKIYVTTDNNKTWRWGGNKYVEISGWNPDSVSKSVTLPTYFTKEAGVHTVTGVTDGAYFNVRSVADDTVAIEYQNVGGSAVATGKSYPSSQVVAALDTKVAKIYHIETHSISDVQDLSEPTGTKLTLHAGGRSGEFTIKSSSEQITLDKTRTDAPLFTLEQAADLDVFNAVFIKTKNGVAVRDISYSIKAGWFGVTYDWNRTTQTGTDDTEKLRAAMYFAAAWELPLSTDSGGVRTTSQLVSQKDGYWKSFTWESNNTEIIVDHDGSGMRFYGGAYKFTQRGTLTFLKSDAFKTTGGNSFPDLTDLVTYSATKNYGVVFDGNQHDVENITAFGFNAGVIFYIGEFNMNYSKHSIRVTGNDLGALVFGPFDDASVIETEITAFENFQEGVYVKSGVNFRQWVGRIRAENNLKDRITNPAIAGRYAVYIGHHIACDLWCYVEQYEYLTPETYELYVSDTGSSEIFSARKNTDYIRGNNTAQSGNTLYQHFYVGNPATRQATPLRLQGFGVRLNDPNDFVEMPIVADNNKYGSVRGQAGRIGLHSQNSSQSITLSDNNIQLGKSFNGIFTDEVALSSASPTLSQLIKTLYLSNEASIGTLTVIGSPNDPTYGYSPYILKVDFYINGGVVTLNTASRMYFNNSEGQSSANIRQDGSNVYLDLTYNPAWHGANYYFKYKLELISALR